MKNTALKPFQVGFGENQVIFNLRLISVSEEDEMTLAFNEIADSNEDKYQQEFNLCKKYLGEYSIDMPQQLVKEKTETKRVPLVDDAETAAGAIEAYFAERTIPNERIIRAAYRIFKTQLAPDSLFLQPSE